MLSEDLKEIVNNLFEKDKISIEIKDLVLFRPVWHEPPFEDIEVFNEPNRLNACNVLYMVISLKESGRLHQCELQYKNVDGSFQNTLCRLMFCDIFPGEDIGKLEKMILSTFKLLGAFILEIIERMTKEGKE